ncbi:Mce protein [Mycobacterium sp. pUA109]|uniref:Mce protein n=1 Tax=Mycobacterium sp. pUA109 TaxID=3238982 RepID=UPI00351B4382
MEPLQQATSTGVLEQIRVDDNELVTESIEPVDPPSDTTANSGRRHVHLHIPLRWLVIGALVAVVAGAGGWLGWVALEHHQRDVAATQALDAAKKYALTLCNIDPSTVDKNFTELFNSSTEEFNDAHAERAAKLRQVLIDKNVRAHGSIAQAIVESVSLDSVKVLLLIDQTVTSTDTPNPAEEHTHIRMTLEKVDGRWLASDVKLR